MPRTSKKLLEDIPYSKRKKASKFLDFLKKKGAFRKYVTNCENLTDRLLTSIEGTTIGGAFTWADTPEDPAYWSGLEDLWLAEQDK